MFGIGVSELLLVFFVALLVLGPERLPAAARSLAKIFGEFKRATDDLRSSIVGISDVDQDWRREHNNPRIVQAKAPPEPEHEDIDDKKEILVVKREEKANG